MPIQKISSTTKKTPFTFAAGLIEFPTEELARDFDCHVGHSVGFGSDCDVSSSADTSWPGAQNQTRPPQTLSNSQPPADAVHFQRLVDIRLVREIIVRLQLSGFIAAKQFS